MHTVVGIARSAPTGATHCKRPGMKTYTVLSAPHARMVWFFGSTASTVQVEYWTFLPEVEATPL